MTGDCKMDALTLRWFVEKRTSAFSGNGSEVLCVMPAFVGGQWTKSSRAESGRRGGSSVSEWKNGQTKKEGFLDVLECVSELFLGVGLLHQ